MTTFIGPWTFILELLKSFQLKSPDFECANLSDTTLAFSPIYNIIVAILWNWIEHFDIGRYFL
jgi:hypothetical protein